MKLTSATNPNKLLALYDPGSNSPYSSVSARNPTLSISEEALEALRRDPQAPFKKHEMRRDETALDEIVATFFFAEQRRKRQREVGGSSGGSRKLKGA